MKTTPRVYPAAICTTRYTVDHQARGELGHPPHSRARDVAGTNKNRKLCTSKSTPTCQLKLWDWLDRLPLNPADGRYDATPWAARSYPSNFELLRRVSPRVRPRQTLRETEFNFRLEVGVKSRPWGRSLCGCSIMFNSRLSL